MDITDERVQLNEAELEVDSEKASYKQKLEVLQQQEELIEDEEEQEHKEEEARRAKREAEERLKREEETKMAESLLPESEVGRIALLHKDFYNAFSKLIL